MATLLDIYQVIDRQTFSGQEVLNVYFYQQNNALNLGVDASDLLTEFETEVLPAIKTCQANALTHTQLEVTNLFNPSDKAVKAISVTGGQIQDFTDNFSAVGIKLTQSNGAVKNGAKRLAGLPDYAAKNGVITDAIYLPSLVALMPKLVSPLGALLADIFFPVIVKRLMVSPGDYRLPTSLLTATWGDILSAVWNPLVTSQTSRKIGRGA